jgi:hypothetical protein
MQPVAIRNSEFRETRFPRVCQGLEFVVYGTGVFTGEASREVSLGSLGHGMRSRSINNPVLGSMVKASPVSY